MADTDSKSEASESTSDSDYDEVFSELSRADLIKCLSEMFEKYSQITLKYKKLQSSLVSQNDRLKSDIAELKEINLKIKTDFEKAQKSESDKAVNSKNILEEYYAKNWNRQRTLEGVLLQKRSLK